MSDPTAAAVTGTQRIAAAVALVAGVATVLLAVTVAIVRFPSGLGVLACVVVAVVAAWFGVVRRGTLRIVGIAVAVLALLGCRGPAVPQQRLALPRGSGDRGGRLARRLADRVPRPRAAARRRATPAAGAVHQPVVRWRKGGQGRTDRGGRPAWDQERGAAQRRRSQAARARRRRRGRGRGRRGGWGRHPGDRGHRGRRTRTALRLYPGGHAQPLRPGSGGGPRRRRRSPGRLRRRRRARRRPGRGQWPGLRQQRLDGAVRRGGAEQGLPQRQDPHPARHRACRLRPVRLRARPAMGVPRRHGPPVGGDHPGVQQPLPARSRRRVRDPAPDRRRQARRGRRPRPGQRRRRAAPRDEPPSPAVVDHRLRGRFDTAGAAGYRWRGGDARPARAIPDTPRHVARTDLPPTPGCVAIGDAARSRRRRSGRPGRDRVRSTAH